jgi:hypothetical protein
MDTTHIEYTAEDFISHKLQLAGFLVAKPKFDREGADLLVFMNIDTGTKFCRIQCKGRSLLNSNSSNIVVLKSYISEAFIVFLLIIDNSKNNGNLYCFFSNDIKKSWKLKTYKNYSKDFYRLTFSKSTFKNTNNNNLSDYLFTDKTVENIKNIIKNSDSNKEFDKLFDLIKTQNELIYLQKQKTKLEKIITEINHIDEVKKLLKDKIKIMKEYYKISEAQIKSKNDSKA